MLRHVVASNNGVGLFTRSSATLRVAHSVVMGSRWRRILDSYGNNDIDGNTNNNTSVLTRSPCISALRAGGISGAPSNAPRASLLAAAGAGLEALVQRYSAGYAAGPIGRNQRDLA
jgi:hypothetical protein